MEKGLENLWILGLYFIYFSKFKLNNKRALPPGKEAPRVN